jgi:hypothetical protein
VPRLPEAGLPEAGLPEAGFTRQVVLPKARAARATSPERPAVERDTPARAMAAPGRVVPASPRTSAVPAPEAVPSQPAIVAHPAQSARPGPGPEASVPSRTRSGAVSPAMSAAGSAPASAPSSPAPLRTLGAELARVDRARAALARGDALQALHELDGYERAFPARQLGLEASMLRMEAHLRRGDLTRARELARRILAAPVPPLHARRAREVLEGSASSP